MNQLAEITMAQEDQLFDRLQVVEETLAKVAKVSEVSQIARIEVRLREYMFLKWSNLANEAAKKAKAMVSSKKGAVKKAEATAVIAAISKIMNGWQKTVGPRLKADIAKSYRLARYAGHKKATGQSKGKLTYDTPEYKLVSKAEKKKIQIEPAFDVVDEEVVAAVSESQVHWIGEHYDESVRIVVADSVRQTLKTGVSRKVAGERIQAAVRESLDKIKTPTGFFGTSKEYFKGLAANAATVTRAHGQLRSFDLAGVTRYEIMNPQDEKTCPVCSHMDGKIFKVSHGVRQMEAEMEAETPDAMKKIHPWLSLKALKAISPKSGAVGSKDAASLADAGFALPPFHFICRCTVDMDTTEEPVF